MATRCADMVSSQTILTPESGRVQTRDQDVAKHQNGFGASAAQNVYLCHELVRQSDVVVECAVTLSRRGGPSCNWPEISAAMRGALVGLAGAVKEMPRTPAGLLYGRGPLRRVFMAKRSSYCPQLQRRKRLPR